MASVQAVNSSIVPFALLAAQAVGRSDLPLGGLGNSFGATTAIGASFVVQLSGLGQALAATTYFQDQLAALQTRPTNSGSDPSEGTDLPSLVARAQTLVDAFNGLGAALSNFQGTGISPGSSGIAGDLAGVLQTRAGGIFDNGTSSLTRLSQIGIVFQGASADGNGGRLSLDLPTLESAFSSDPDGAFALLSEAAKSFSDLADGFVRQGTSSLFASRLLLDQELLGGLLFSASPFASNSLDLTGLLALGSLGRADSGAVSLQRSLIAINQFSLVSALI